MNLQDEIAKNLINESYDDSDFITIRTGFSDEQADDVLNSVIGQLSDGIWENTPSMKRYWEYMDIDKQGNEIVVKFNIYNYSSGFRGKDEQQIRKWLANKIKQIVKEEGLEWSRDNTERANYLDYHSGCTVQDAYRVYDRILGRKDYIPDPSKKTEAIENDIFTDEDIKDIETEPDIISTISREGNDFIETNKHLNKDKLFNQLNDDILDQYIFNEELYENSGDIELIGNDKNISISYDEDKNKLLVSMGAVKTSVNNLDEAAQFINKEITETTIKNEAKLMESNQELTKIVNQEFAKQTGNLPPVHINYNGKKYRYWPLLNGDKGDGKVKCMYFYSPDEEFKNAKEYFTVLYQKQKHVEVTYDGIDSVIEVDDNSN